MEQLKVKIAGEIALSNDPGKAMKKWREVFGVSQTELSEHLKITPSTISDYESNRRKSPGIAVIRRFVDALVDIDIQKGGELVKRFKEAEESKEFFDAIDFPKPINASDFAKIIGAEVVAGQEKLEEKTIYGATILDSQKVILELPYESFVKIYGSTNQRALIFTGVSTGRSPLVAVRIAPIKPAVIVLHGVKEVDKLAIKIADSEGIPLLATMATLEELKKKLKDVKG
ncbi:MAG TPA: helix-turn-helix domain-containing protein [Candidatus Norongarragalinales archaeon]|jgi:putative transcriptional regulator|nr:helix-turn-helix domain-containing protein [Candidatus Norongarragalinales archaeon]